MSAVPQLLSESPAALAALARARILYTDLDGTLLGIGGSVLVDGDGRPSAATAEAVVALNAARLDVVIVSGRNRAQTGEISRVLGWRGCIAELGSVIVRDRGEAPEYYTGDWAPGAVAEDDTPHAVIERSGALSALQAAFPGRIEEHAPYHRDREATHVLRGHVDPAAAQAILDPIEPAIALVDNGIIHPLRTTLVDVDEVHAYHLVPKGVTKSGAVARDLEERGITRERAIAVGDSAIDVSMAGAVGLMVLVGNALDDERTLEAASAHDNVVAVRGTRGEGWAELAHAWLGARTG